MDKAIYILHESGAGIHHRALKFLCDKNSVEIKHYEFTLLKNIIKSFFKLDIHLFIKQFQNIAFIFALLFTKNKKILLGIAPYDFRLIFLKYILKNHKVYYHTSWICWDGTYYPKKLFVNNFVINTWKDFLQKDIVTIFSVTQQTKNQLIKNIGLEDEKIKVVYHSFDSQIFYKYNLPYSGKLEFLYAGRIVDQKGILEILEYFSRNQNINLSLIGDGSLRNKALEYSNKYKNIKYLGYISCQEELAKIYNKHHFLLLNSKKIGYWEELFGMVIIEAMASGVVPLTTDHKGPLEIIDNGVDGYVFEECKFIEGLDNIISKFNKNGYEKMQSKGLEKAKQFTLSNVSQKWQAILND